jgi:hypothetical protein
MDVVIKVIEGVGEIGIDREASPGNGSYYAKLYDGSFDESGFDTLEDAENEFMFYVDEELI